MKYFSKLTKVGFALMLIDFIAMTIILLVGESVPTLFVALFVEGMVMTLISECVNRRNKMK